MARRDDRSAEALAGELLGAPVTIRAAPGIVPLPLEGTLVDESLRTFLVRRAPDGRVVRIQKTGLVGTVRLALGEIPLNGELLRHRPEDWTKRLAPRGRRS